MDEKTIRIIIFTGEKEKCRLWLVKFMAKDLIEGCYVLLTGAKKIPDNDADKTKDR